MIHSLWSYHQYSFLSLHVLQKNNLIDLNKINQLLDQCLRNNEIKKALKELYKSDKQKEKEWIVYYNHMDVGHRVTANSIQKHYC